jgi:predicted metal-dependent hydrolase
MPSLRIRHRIERTKNKHSRAVLRENTIIIRLARNLSRSEESTHIEYLLKRMKIHAKNEQEKTLIHPFYPLLQGGQRLTVTLATGKQYIFSLQPGNRTECWRIRPLVLGRRLEGFRITVSPKLRRRSLHRLLWKLLSEAELSRMTSLVARINQQTFRSRIRPVALRIASSQWGSCSPRGLITLNSALLFVPPSLLRYIIIHELAHTVQRNHSKAFWREVEWAMGTYKEAVEDLHDYRLCQL